MSEIFAALDTDVPHLGVVTMNEVLGALESIVYGQHVVTVIADFTVKLIMLLWLETALRAPVDHVGTV